MEVLRAERLVYLGAGDESGPIGRDDPRVGMRSRNKSN
jgi:hypothetical protein